MLWSMRQLAMSEHPIGFTTQPAAQQQNELDDALTLDFIRSLIHDLRVDEMAFEQGMASSEKRDEFRSHRSGQLSPEVVQQIHERRNAELTLESLRAFFEPLMLESKLNDMITDLAVKISGHKVYIWVAVDTSTKDGIAFEMKTLRAYADAQMIKGAGISVIVVETDDNYPVPLGYVNLMDDKDQSGSAGSIS